MDEYLSHSPEETEALGEALAQRLRAGDVVAYRGDLGAGKTAFTRGLARGLGCMGREIGRASCRERGEERV